jgi:hypothetical protein
MGVDLDHIRFVIIAANSSNNKSIVIATNTSHIKVAIIGADNNISTKKCTTTNIGIRSITTYS